MFDGSYFEYYPAAGVKFLGADDLLAYTEFDYRRVNAGMEYVVHFNFADLYTFDDGPDRLHIRYSAFHPALDIATMRESRKGSFFMSNWLTICL